jgi:hypothetical protein
MKKLIITLFLSLTCEIAVAGPILYGIGENGGSSVLYSVDTTTGGATFIGNTGQSLRGLAINPLTGRAYASASTQSGGTGFYEIDLASGTASIISTLGNFATLEFDGLGNLYGYTSRNTGYDFFNIDEINGTGVLLNDNALNTGVHALFDIAFSSFDNEMYFYQQWSGGTGDGISTVNLADGTVTSVSTGPLQQYRPDIAVDNSGNFYALDRVTNSSLYSLNTTTASTSLIGLNGVRLQSIAFAENVQVPEPSTLAIFALGMIGLASRRFKKQ